jgi:hypothetical protein
MSFSIGAIGSQGPTGPQRAQQPSPAGQAFQQMLQQLSQTQQQQPQLQGPSQDAMVSFSAEAMESLSTTAPGLGQGGGAHPGQLEQQIQSGDLALTVLAGILEQILQSAAPGLRIGDGHLLIHGLLIEIRDVAGSHAWTAPIEWDGQQPLTWVMSLSGSPKLVATVYAAQAGAGGRQGQAQMTGHAKGTKVSGWVKKMAPTDTP